MQYIQYTLVDNKTGVPVSKTPARNGPRHPNGITPTFIIQDTQTSGVPTLFGIAEDDYTPEHWMRSVSESEFFLSLKNEFKERATIKRRQVEKAGYWVNSELFITTDDATQIRLAQLVTTINNDSELVNVDFEISKNKWLLLDRGTVLEIGLAVSRHVQRCFSWCKLTHDTIDSITSLDDVLPIIQSINEFKVEDNR
jgi:hypothetical protein